MKPAVLCVEPIVMKGDDDCAIASLAMLLGKPYSEVYSMARRRRQAGLWSTDIRRIARRFGRQLTSYRQPLPQTPTGVLIVERPSSAHAVLVFQGVVVNPADGLLWDFDAFLSQGNWRVRHLLTDVAEQADP